MKKENEGTKWTPEEKAALRAKLPGELTEAAKRFFSDDPDKGYLVVKDWKAVMR
ncbi:MAG: hypothetical protein LUC33_06260 [Prevotellaceae bacterium]|nr:hypothetical protein [Prevotellaceae bacterium]